MNEKLSPAEVPTTKSPIVDINPEQRVNTLEDIKKREAYSEKLSKGPIGTVFQALNFEQQDLFVKQIMKSKYTPDDISALTARCSCGSTVGSDGVVRWNNIMSARIWDNPLIGKTPNAMSNKDVEKKGNNFYLNWERIPHASEIIGKIPVPLSPEAISKGIRTQSAKELLETGNENLFNNIIDNFDKISPEDKNIVLKKIKEHYGNSLSMEYPWLMGAKALFANKQDKLLYLPDVKNQKGDYLGLTFWE